MNDEEIMRERFEYLMANPNDPRAIALRHVLLLPFDEASPAPARRVLAMGA